MHVDIGEAHARAWHARGTLRPLTSRGTLMHEPQSRGSYCSCISRASSNEHEMRAKDPSRGALAATFFCRPRGTWQCGCHARWVCSLSDEHFHRRSRAHIAPWPRGRCLDSVCVSIETSSGRQRSAEVRGGGARVWLHKGTLTEQPRLSPNRSEMRDS